jgi:SnoaL-like domain
MTDRAAGNVASPASTDALAQLRDAEAICLLKHRYMRCLDLKRWAEIADTLTGNAAYVPGTSAFGRLAEIVGRAEIVAFLRAKLGSSLLTDHTAGQPEIKVDGDTATGIWSYRETVMATEHRMLVSGTGFCEERYERCADAQWRIAEIRYVRGYEMIMSFDDLPSLRLIMPPGGYPPQDDHAAVDETLAGLGSAADSSAAAGEADVWR